ncbi:MAG: hypothetical protein AB1Z98_40440 [Nannocystaceae bacterium]
MTLMLALVVFGVVVVAAYFFVEEPPAGSPRRVSSAPPDGAGPTIPRAAVRFEVFARRAGFSPSHDGATDLAETSQ